MLSDAYHEYPTFLFLDGQAIQNTTFTAGKGTGQFEMLQVDGVWKITLFSSFYPSKIFRFQFRVSKGRYVFETDGLLIPIQEIRFRNEKRFYEVQLTNDDNLPVLDCVQDIVVESPFTQVNEWTYTANYSFYNESGFLLGQNTTNDMNFVTRMWRREGCYNVTATITASGNFHFLQ